MKDFRLPDQGELQKTYISHDIVRAYKNALFARREGLPRAPFYYEQETAVMNLIKSGNLERLQNYICSLNTGITIEKLSDDELQHSKYAFVAMVTLCTRAAIDGGLNELNAYTLSDVYVRKCDKCISTQALEELGLMAIKDFTQRVNAAKKLKIMPSAVVKCLRYIDDNLHSRITLSHLSESCGLSTRYLSKLFREAVGVSAPEYILQKKLETAANMLIMTNSGLAEISECLGFSSPSAFGVHFKEKYGATPRVYRAHTPYSVL